MNRVIIVDDQSLFRGYLYDLLCIASFKVVGEAVSIPDAEILAGDLQPDLAVVDVSLPGLDGISGAPRLKRAAPKMRVILVSSHDASRAARYRLAAQEAGADAFIPKYELDLSVVRAWAEMTQGKR